MIKKFLLILTPLLLLGAGCQRTDVDQAQVIQKQRVQINELAQRLNSVTTTTTQSDSETEKANNYEIYQTECRDEYVQKMATVDRLVQGATGISKEQAQSIGRRAGIVDSNGFVINKDVWVKNCADTKNGLMESSSRGTDARGHIVIPPTESLKAAYLESAHRSAMADIAEVACLPQSRFDCDLEGCTPEAPSAYFFVDYGSESGTYFRCDAKDCDHYPVKVTRSGIYTQFTPILGQAMLFKLAADDDLGNKGDFVDVATIGTSALVSSGRCEFKPLE